MLITNELGPRMDEENRMVADYHRQLNEINMPMSAKSEHDLRMGFRTKWLLDLALERASRGLNPFTGEN